MTCYLRNGTKAKRALPCNHTAIIEGKHTSCCDPDDLCLTNGLCRDPAADDMTNFAWFFGCTDKTFKDPSCGNYCDKVNKINNQLTFQCPQRETWCCNTGDPSPNTDRINRTNTTCCSISDLLFKAPEPTIYTTALYSGVSFSVNTLLSPSTAATLSRYPTGMPTITSTQSKNSSVNLGLASVPAAPQPGSPTLSIGLGAGLGLFGAILFVLGGIFAWRRRAKNQQPSNELSSDDRIELAGQDIAEAMADKERFEMISDPRFEMMAEVHRAELPADTKDMHWPELAGEGETEQLDS